MSESIRFGAASTQSVLPLADPYGIPHKWDSVRCVSPAATPEELLTCLNLIYAVKVSDRDRELLLKWFSPYMLGPDMETHVRATKPSGAEVRSTINYLRTLAILPAACPEIGTTLAENGPSTPVDNG